MLFDSTQWTYFLSISLTCNKLGLLWSFRAAIAFFRGEVQLKEDIIDASLLV